MLNKFLTDKYGNGVNGLPIDFPDEIDFEDEDDYYGFEDLDEIRDFDLEEEEEDEVY